MNKKRNRKAIGLGILFLGLCIGIYYVVAIHSLKIMIGKLPIKGETTISSNGPMKASLVDDQQQVPIEEANHASSLQQEVIASTQPQDTQEQKEHSSEKHSQVPNVEPTPRGGQIETENQILRKINPPPSAVGVWSGNASPASNLIVSADSPSVPETSIKPSTSSGEVDPHARAINDFYRSMSSLEHMFDFLEAFRFEKK